MELTNEQKRALLAPVKCFLLDMDGTFYLDTRITLQGVRDHPATNLVALHMTRTLFEPTEGADDP